MKKTLQALLNYEKLPLPIAIRDKRMYNSKRRYYLYFLVSGGAYEKDSSYNYSACFRCRFDICL
jgi:hypothetical protein